MVPQIIKRNKITRKQHHIVPYVISQLITTKQHHMVPHVIPQLITRKQHHIVSYVIPQLITISHGAHDISLCTMTKLWNTTPH
jgi:hypothetical protein